MASHADEFGETPDWPGGCRLAPATTGGSGPRPAPALAARGRDEPPWRVWRSCDATWWWDRNSAESDCAQLGGRRPPQTQLPIAAGSSTSNHRSARSGVDSWGGNLEEGTRRDRPGTIRIQQQGPTALKPTPRCTARRDRSLAPLTTSAATRARSRTAGPSIAR